MIVVVSTDNIFIFFSQWSLALLRQITVPDTSVPTSSIITHPLLVSQHFTNTTPLCILQPPNYYALHVFTIPPPPSLLRTILSDVYLITTF